MMGNPMKVSQVVSYLAKIIKLDLILNDITIEGEISNFVFQRNSGHMYFSLKDEHSRLRSVIFKSANESLEFIPKDGMHVIARGSISIYERGGELNFNIKRMEEAGVGKLFSDFLKLKEKLSAEGLFENSRKKKLPLIPMKVGIITSPTGAAIRDILNVSKRRFPLCHLFLYPSLVQGEQAPAELIAGLRFFNISHPVDVIIIGRGGGSYEELSVFNDEDLAREIDHSKIPVVSAVGHEVDFTISDFVADLRAPTPSAGAEMVMPDITFLLRQLQSQRLQLQDVSWKNLKDRSALLTLFRQELFLYEPMTKIQHSGLYLDQLITQMQYRVLEIFNEKTKHLSEIKTLLEEWQKKHHSDPITILNELEQEIRRKADLAIDDLLKINFEDGAAIVKVIKFLEDCNE